MADVYRLAALFLTFSDYARNAIRLAAIMQTKVIFVYTHDSIGLGEDGPTHQPIEHITSLRAMPGLSVFRPCDAVETALAWQKALEHNGPTCLLLSRQNVSPQKRSAGAVQHIERGGYVLVESAGEPELILIATGSEVDLAVQAAKEMTDKKVRVVSMPSVDVFLRQDRAYQESVLPERVGLRIAIEAGASASWYRLIGCRGRALGLDHFGASAPAKALFEHYGFTVQQIISIAKDMFAKEAGSKIKNVSVLI